MAQRAGTHNLIACHFCGMLYRRARLRRADHARCRRCGGSLCRDNRRARRQLIPLLITALLLFVVVATFPLVEIDLHGMHARATLWGTVAVLCAGATLPVALVVFAATLLFPVLDMLALLYVAIAIRRQGLTKKCRLALRLIQHIRPWCMLEIFLLGVIVALAKLAAFAIILPGFALCAYGLLMLATAALSSFEPRTLWWHMHRSTAL